MYQYSEFDKNFLKRRVDQFRDQVNRRISGALTEDEFRPLRLMNGLYLQLHAYMLRVAIPYGTLSARQMRALADIADRFDRGYGHFTTRQNIQFNWPRLTDVPDILEELARVDMHAIQTSGSCIRTVTSDHFAGASADEIDDPRPTAELIRQWSTDHPEFAFLPRKFKIAVVGSEHDRAAMRFHDIGLQLVRGERGAKGYRVFVGGGLGRTPFIGQVVREFLPRIDLLPYLEAILQVYNQIGRRDNKYKARIKITLHENGLEHLHREIEDRFKVQRAKFGGFDQRRLEEIEKMFFTPALEDLPVHDAEKQIAANPVLRSFVDTNVKPHRQPGYAIVSVSLKRHGETPGDATSEQMRVLADIAETYAHGELRVSHEQNIILPHVPRAHLPEVHRLLLAAGLGTANIGRISDIIACPGMDYCDLATARSISVAQEIATRFEMLNQEQEIGDLKIKISGCINACGHHHVGQIGILGLEKGGVESYQITLGGDASEHAAIGDRMGPGFAAGEILPAIEAVIDTYLSLRLSREESFNATYRRLGMGPFRAAVYENERVNYAA